MNHVLTGSVIPLLLLHKIIMHPTIVCVGSDAIRQISNRAGTLLGLQAYHLKKALKTEILYVYYQN